MSTDKNNFYVYLQHHKSLLDEFLSKILPKPDPQHKLFDAMRYSVLNDGKRLRPALVYATGDVLQLTKAKLHGVAAAVELIHCYSLIHDDLPAMDDDDLRRGLPSCHKAFDEATAILAGDALQALAFEVLGDPELNPNAANQQIAMIKQLAKAVGSAGMVLGQALDMASEHKVLNLPNLITLHRHKTGDLFNACIELAILADVNSVNNETKEFLRSYGQHLGLAFQIQDDILDVTGTTATIGKPQGSDQKHAKSTFTSLLGLENARKHADEHLNQALAAAAQLGPTGETLINLAKYLITRTC